MTDSVSEIAARLRAGLEDGPDFICHTTSKSGTTRTEVYRVDGDDLRAILAENERLARERDESEDRCGKYADENQQLYDKFRAVEDKLAALSSTFEATEARACKAEAELHGVSNAIATVEFLDPPDGGDVPLSVQVRRMKRALTDERSRISQLEQQLREARELLQKLHDDPYMQNVAHFSTPVEIRMRKIRAFLNKDTPHD